MRRSRTITAPTDLRGHVALVATKWAICMKYVSQLGRPVIWSDYGAVGCGTRRLARSKRKLPSRRRPKGKHCAPARSTSVFGGEVHELIVFEVDVAVLVHVAHFLQLGRERLAW